MSGFSLLPDGLHWNSCNLCSWGIPNPNRTAPTPCQKCILRMCHVTSLHQPMIFQNPSLRRKWMPVDHSEHKTIKGSLLLFSTDWYICKFCSKYVGSHFTPGSQGGKVCSWIITNSLGKTQSFQTQTKLPACDCTGQPESPYQPTPLAGTYSAPLWDLVERKIYSSGTFQTR